MISLVSNNTATATAGAAKDEARLKSAAQAFEAVFLRQMISSMRSASLGDGLLDSSASNQFRDMADAKVADSMAEKGVLGIAEMLARQLGKTVAAQVDDRAAAEAGAA